MTRFDIAPPPSMHPEIAILMATLDDSTREWIGEIEPVSDEAVVWQPIPGGISIGGLLLHMSLVEIYWLHSCCAGESIPEEALARFCAAETRVDEGVWPTPPARPFQTYFDDYLAIRRRSHELMATVTDPERIFARADWEADFTVRWIVGHVVQHDAYHGGQAVLLHEMWKRRA